MIFSKEKSYIKYNKTNMILPIRTHIDCAHPILLIQRKLVLFEKIVEANHSWQPKLAQTFFYLGCKTLNQTKVWAKWVCKHNIFWRHEFKYKKCDEVQKQIFKKLT
jgi:hypothetical protein